MEKAFRVSVKHQESPRHAKYVTEYLVIAEDSDRAALAGKNVFTGSLPEYEAKVLEVRVEADDDKVFRLGEYRAR